MNNDGLNSRLARLVLRNFILERISKILAAIIIVIVAAAASAVAKHILQPALAQHGRGFGMAAMDAAPINGALEQVGKAPAIVNGMYYGRPVLMSGPVMSSIGVGGIAFQPGSGLT